MITVVDRAVAPRRREWPQRALITGAAAVLGGVLGLLCAAAAVLVADWAQRNPAEAEALSRTATRVATELRGALRRRPRLR